MVLLVCALIPLKTLKTVAVTSLSTSKPNNFNGTKNHNRTQMTEITREITWDFGGEIWGIENERVRLMMNMKV